MVKVTNSPGSQAHMGLGATLGLRETSHRLESQIGQQGIALQACTDIQSTARGTFRSGPRTPSSPGPAVLRAAASNLGPRLGASHLCVSWDLLGDLRCCARGLERKWLKKPLSSKALACLTSKIAPGPAFLIVRLQRNSDLRAEGCRRQRKR